VGDGKRKGEGKSTLASIWSLQTSQPWLRLCLLSSLASSRPRPRTSRQRPGRCISRSQNWSLSCCEISQPLKNRPFLNDYSVTSRNDGKTAYLCRPTLKFAVATQSRPSRESKIKILNAETNSDSCVQKSRPRLKIESQHVWKSRLVSKTTTMKPSSAKQGGRRACVGWRLLQCRWINDDKTDLAVHWQSATWQTVLIHWPNKQLQTRPDFFEHPVCTWFLGPRESIRKRHLDIRYCTARCCSNRHRRSFRVGLGA